MRTALLRLCDIIYAEIDNKIAAGEMFVDLLRDCACPARCGGDGFA